MVLAAATRLGPYEILGLIGVGGMGEVYKARDTRLDRTVAIKVLPSEVSGDPARRSRFEREAKTIATLSHAHICALHDVGEHNGSLFLVMEYLAGETLADRLRKGALPIDQALDTGVQIAEALSAAHRAGIIHRDLKPANVMLTTSGVKLLDFGLAKLTEHGDQPAAAQFVSAPTRSTPLTAEGVILGTLQYMAPEQIEGRPADGRTDLWALGAILYEMVTGKRAFEASSAPSLIGAILEREPAPLSSSQPLTPPGIDRLVRQCLAKSPDDRPDTAHDLANHLRWLRETAGPEASTGGRTIRARIHASYWVLIGAVLGGILSSLVWALARPESRPSSVVRLSLDVRPAEQLNAGGVGISDPIWTPGGSRTALTWTPDGASLVFVGRRGAVQQLYVRALDAMDARPLVGTEGAQVPTVSPDGRWVAFWADRALKKIALGGGPVVELTSGMLVPPAGLCWDDRGNLYFPKDGDISRLSPDGAVSPVTAHPAMDWSTSVFPSILPGGNTLLFTVRKRDWSWGDEEIVALELSTGTRKVLLRDAVDARYVPTGHLVFLRRGVLFAVPFDPVRLEIRGAPVAVLDGVVQALTGNNSADVTGAGQFAIAPTGTLACVRGPIIPYQTNALVAVDRHGNVSQLAAPEASHLPFRVAPNGQQIAMPIRGLNNVSLWTYDLVRGTLTPLTRSGEAYGPIWTPDGRRLVFDWLEGNRRSLAWQWADGTGSPERFGGRQGDAPSSWTPDGKHLAVITWAYNLGFVTVENGRTTDEPEAKTPELEEWPEFSPDGHWLAHGSDISGRDEIYVQPYPGPGPRTQVSVQGGEGPIWQRDGHAIYFLAPLVGDKRRMMTVRFDPGPPMRVGVPQVLFEFSPREVGGFEASPTRGYDMAPDGQHFYAMRGRPRGPTPPVTQIEIIQNWFEELKAKVPVK